jgi:hypothetical protein
MNTRMCTVDGVSASLPPQVWGVSPKGLPVIRVERLTSDVLSEAIMQALREPAYKAAAMRIQQQMALRPGLEAAVKLLEDLGSSFEPLRPANAQ